MKGKFRLYFVYLKYLCEFPAFHQIIIVMHVYKYFSNQSQNMANIHIQNKCALGVHFYAELMNLTKCDKKNNTNNNIKKIKKDNNNNNINNNN